MIRIVDGEDIEDREPFCSCDAICDGDDDHHEEDGYQGRPYLSRNQSSLISKKFIHPSSNIENRNDYVISSYADGPLGRRVRERPRDVPEPVRPEEGGLRQADQRHRHQPAALR